MSTAPTLQKLDHEPKSEVVQKPKPTAQLLLVKFDLTTSHRLQAPLEEDMPL